MTAEPFHLSVSDDVLADLRTRPSDTMDRFVAVAAELLAERVGLRPDDPEPQIAAAVPLRRAHGSSRCAGTVCVMMAAPMVRQARLWLSMIRCSGRQPLRRAGTG